MSDLFFTPSPSFENNFFPQVACPPSILQKQPLLAVIYAGQHDVEFTIYTAPKLKYILSKKQDVVTYKPQAGWYEQDPEEIMSAVYRCCEDACNELISHGYMRSDIEAISITNQRETIVVWNACTGKPLYRAIAVDDSRATLIAEKIVASLPRQDQNYYKSIAGLPVLPNFPALKICWLQENVENVRNAIAGDYCKVGTLDSWIVWNLTQGALHITDVTNAAYTLLMNINTLKWDRSLLKVFSIKSNMLPQIRCCSEIFGVITEPLCVLQTKFITGIIADQQALLQGQVCLQPDKISVHFGRSCCLLRNIGKKCIFSKEAITTVAYKLDAGSSCTYVLEGNVVGCGNLFTWLQTKFRILPDIKFIEDLAKTVRTTNNVYFVPAFKGLFAPYWRKDARGTLVGLTDKTNCFHIVRAALESVCFQIHDIIESMRSTRDFNPDVIYAAGPYAENQLLMQILADISGLTVVHFDRVDPISYGAAICGGHAIKAVDMYRVKQGVWSKSMDFQTYIPFTREEQRIKHYTKWRRAVVRSLNWTQPTKPLILDAKKNKVLLNGSMAGILSITMVLFLINALRT